MKLAAAQAFMQKYLLDGWLVHDFRGNNTVLAQLLPGKRWTTRRAVLWVPARGEAVLLAHGIDAGQFRAVPEQVKGVRVENYLSWRELHAWLRKVVEGGGGGARVAMEYAPGATLPVVSIVDAGTVELVRSMGVEVVSSADLIQATVAVWSDDAVKRHAEASCKVAGIKDAAFGLIRERLAAGKGVTEYEVQQHIMERFKEAGLETPDPPIVGVNAHSADPHFEVSATSPSSINRGDWVLIDLWARVPGDENIYSDITWVGVCAKEPTPRQREIFNVVKKARDASVKLAQESWRAKQTVQGWQLDEAARAEIIGAGFENFIRHRTGHSLSPGAFVHGMGMNLDNLETHDTRAMLPGIGFTVEPGIYLPESDGGFGVRLEINLWVDPAKGPVVTSCVQEEVVCMTGRVEQNS